MFISSTGGHLDELLQLKPLFSKYDSYIITEKDKSNENLKRNIWRKIVFFALWNKSKIIYIYFKYFYLCLRTVYLYLRIRPKVIITTGTHTAGPMCILGKVIWK